MKQSSAIQKRKPLNVLLSAYACRPDVGSEPGKSWNLALALSQYHNVHVITRSENKPHIEKALCALHQSGQQQAYSLNFIYHSRIPLGKYMNDMAIVTNLQYYIWQLTALSTVKRYLKTQKIDVGHHLSYARYWNPSFLPHLDIPYFLGPVGGGESTPKHLYKLLPSEEIISEKLREVFRIIGENDPLTRMTLKRAQNIFANTNDTKACLHNLGFKNVTVVSGPSPSNKEIAQMEIIAKRKSSGPKYRRFVSLGRILGWKGFEQGIRAFAKLDRENTEYWIIGDGPQKAKLEKLVKSLNVKHRVKFLERVSREEALTYIKDSIALVHPSFHDSGGWTCVEAMMLGTHVICLDHAGPGLIVDSKLGTKIPCNTDVDLIVEIKEALNSILEAGAAPDNQGRLGRRYIKRHHSAEAKALLFDFYYQKLVDNA